MYIDKECNKCYYISNEPYYKNSQVNPTLIFELIHRNNNSELPHFYVFVLFYIHKTRHTSLRIWPRDMHLITHHIFRIAYYTWCKPQGDMRVSNNTRLNLLIWETFRQRIRNEQIDVRTTRKIDNHNRIIAILIISNRYMFKRTISRSLDYVCPT